jgi:hypothetical protein
MPQLVQFGDLTPSHFIEHPVWVSCHTRDYDEAWYDETDEETFRPYDGSTPADPADGMLLVRAELKLANGKQFEGFLSPAMDDGSGDALLGSIQPQMFVTPAQRFGFWLGMFGDAKTAAEAFYATLGLERESVFPISFNAVPNLALGKANGILAGFYTIPDGSTVSVAS